MADLVAESATFVSPLHSELESDMSENADEVIDLTLLSEEENIVIELRYVSILRGHFKNIK